MSSRFASVGRPVVDGVQQLTDETHHVGLDVIIGPTGDELGNAARADALQIGEVPAQDLDCLLGLGIVEERVQPGKDVADTGPVVSDDVEEDVYQERSSARTRSAASEARSGCSLRSRYAWTGWTHLTPSRSSAP